MPKNKSVKRKEPRKARIPNSKPKLFCPRTMVRYDDSISDYKSIWVCKMCLVSLLSPEAVKQHVIKCNAGSNKAKLKPIKKNEDTRYICELCNKEFSRRVRLKKHSQEHENCVDSEPSDNNVDADPFITEDANDQNYKPEEDNS